MDDVFLSFDARDAVSAEVTAAALRTRGLTVFAQHWYRTAGDAWSETLQRRMSDCRAAVLLLGPHGMGRWQQRERELAMEQHAEAPSFRVIPVLLPGGEPALGLLSLYVWVDLREQPDAPGGLDLLAAATLGDPIGARGESAVQATRASICPYRGLNPFREEDAAVFRGRQVFTRRLLEKVEKADFLAVVGPSGSGKSSVVQAGLVPRLRRGLGRGPWEVAQLTPTGRPLRALAAEMTRLLEPEASEVERLAALGQLEQAFAQGHVRLGDVVERILETQRGTKRLLLVVDQWEELYALCSDGSARTRFIELVLEATGAGVPLVVVLTLRADFYQDALGYRPLADRLQDAVVNLGLMTREELEQAIELPAAQVHLGFEPGLVERLLEQVLGQPGSLPLLEFVLAELWRTRSGQRLTHEAYEAIGELKGAIAHRVERLHGVLSAAEQEAVRHLFLDHLVQLGEGDRGTRRRAAASELTDGQRELSRRLATERLLVVGRDLASGQETVEVAHEALLTQWSRLQAWLAEDREFLLWRARLGQALALWEDARRDPRNLLGGRPCPSATLAVGARPKPDARRARVHRGECPGRGDSRLRARRAAAPRARVGQGPGPDAVRGRQPPAQVGVGSGGRGAAGDRSGRGCDVVPSAGRGPPPSQPGAAGHGCRSFHARQRSKPQHLAGRRIRPDRHRVRCWPGQSRAAAA
ncbi:MAG: TIR domain-containing protein [Candidatus Riflebacteria bacterium]|nr:TIR domain-containing protein [Candidatus Riflebacteria bacterium]